MLQTLRTQHPLKFRRLCRRLLKLPSLPHRLLKSLSLQKLHNLLKPRNLPRPRRPHSLQRPRHPKMLLLRQHLKPPLPTPRRVSLNPSPLRHLCQSRLKPSLLRPSRLYQSRRANRRVRPPFLTQAQTNPKLHLPLLRPLPPPRVLLPPQRRQRQRQLRRLLLR